VYDVAIVGGGPAGLSAALWSARYRRKTVVFDSGVYRNAAADHMHGYLGDDPAVPEEFRARAHEQLARYPHVELSSECVASAALDDRVVQLWTDGGAHEAARLILATGVVDEFPSVENFFEHYGASVFHCPSCDGYEASGRAIAVFGWSEHVAGFALGLLDWAASVTVVTDGHAFDGDRRHRRALDRAGVAIVEDEAVALVGRRGDLRHVALRSGPVLPCELAFFSIAHTPRTGLGEQLGCARTADGYLRVDGERRTTSPRVYAAGDVTPGCQLVQVAAAEGAVAGTMCASSLHGELGAPDSVEPAPMSPD
jgi:thioredoxin reductase